MWGFIAKDKSLSRGFLTSNSLNEVELAYVVIHSRHPNVTQVVWVPNVPTSTQHLSHFWWSQVSLVERRDAALLSTVDLSKEPPKPPSLFSMTLARTLPHALNSPLVPMTPRLMKEGHDIRLNVDERRKRI